jgi:RNA polymerase sigma-70 factor, ECF subfamily
MEQSVRREVQQSVPPKGFRPLHEQADEELITAFQSGNEAAFMVLVGRYKDPLTNFAYRFLGDRDECDDVVQETFIRLHRNRHSYRPVARFSTWLYTITTNLAKTALRRRRRKDLMSFWRQEGDSQAIRDIPDEREGPDQAAEASLRQIRIENALAALPAKYREIVVLRDIQELSYEEIVEITGMNMGTVKSRLNRARSKLREMLHDIWNE